MRVSYGHIPAVERMNRLTINVWQVHAESQKTYLHRKGNVMYCRNGLVNLLLVENEKGEAHYIYIKKTGTPTPHLHHWILQG